MYLCMIMDLDTSASDKFYLEPKLLTVVISTVRSGNGKNGLKGIIYIFQ